MENEVISIPTPYSSPPILPPSPRPRGAAQTPVLSQSARALKFRGRLGPLPCLNFPWTEPSYPAKEPGARSAQREGSWVARRRAASERRLPSAGEPTRERPEQGVAEQRLLGLLEGRQRRWDQAAMENGGWEWGQGGVQSGGGRTRARARGSCSRAPGRGTHSGFVINALGSPRAAQLSAL